MSSFANEYVSQRVEPLYFNKNDRCEFRIEDPGKFIDPATIRISHLAVQASANTAHFPVNAGVWSYIKSISLYQDNVLLNYLSRGQSWMGFYNMLGTNGDQQGLRGANIMNRNDYEVSPTTPHQIRRVDSSYYNSVTNALATNNEAMIVLSKGLPLLQQMPYIDTNVFNKLRIVVEFESNTAQVFTDNKTITDSTQPLLNYEEMNPQFVKNIGSSYTIPFTQMLLENVIVDVIGGDDTSQIINSRLKAFDSQVVRRLLIANEVQNQTYSTATGYRNSVRFCGENYKIEINGYDLIPYNGVSNPNQALALTNDSWGRFVLPQGSQQPILTNNQNEVQVDNVWEGVGYMSTAYLGLNVFTKIDEMILKYERTSLSNALPNDGDRLGFTMRVWGECERVLVVNGNKFDVQM